MKFALRKALELSSASLQVAPVPFRHMKDVSAASCTYRQAYTLSFIVLNHASLGCRQCRTTLDSVKMPHLKGTKYNEAACYRTRPRLS